MKKNTAKTASKFIRQHAESSMITSIAYNPTTKVLEVVFCHGGIYEYENIGQDFFEKFNQADSKGKFFNAEVRPNFSPKKVRD